MIYQCQTCPDQALGLAAARRHAKQGHRTQREAFAAGQLHSLALIPKAVTRPDRPDRDRSQVGNADSAVQAVAAGLALDARAVSK